MYVFCDKNLGSNLKIKKFIKKKNDLPKLFSKNLVIFFQRLHDEIFFLQIIFQIFLQHLHLIPALVQACKTNKAHIVLVDYDFQMYHLIMQLIYQDLILSHIKQKYIYDVHDS